MPTLNEEQRRLLMEEKQRLNEQYRRAVSELREREKRHSPPAQTVVIKANSEVWWTIVKAFLITLTITSVLLAMGLAAAGWPFRVAIFYGAVAFVGFGLTALVAVLYYYFYWLLLVVLSFGCLGAMLLYGIALIVGIGSPPPVPAWPLG